MTGQPVPVDRDLLDRLRQGHQIDAAVNESIEVKNLCVALTSIWWGWGHDDRLSWHLSSPAWPLIFREAR